MDIAKQKQQLMLIIENYQNDECQSLLSSAHEKVRNKIKTAFRKAREDVHSTIITERSRAEERIHQAQAELETKRRKQSIQADTLILELGIKRIKLKLLNSWLNNNSRRTWIKAAMQTAVKNLPNGDWYLHHSLDWSEKDSRLVNEFSQSHKINVYFQANPEIKSGVKIEVEETVLDMTETGLLADQQRLESRFLALFHQVASS